MKTSKRSFLPYLFTILLAALFCLALLTSCKSGEEAPGQNVQSGGTLVDHTGTPGTSLFSFSDLELTGGDTARIVPDFAPDAGITFDEIEYSVTEGTDVVSVDGYFVTAKAAGKAVIYAEYKSDRTVYSSFNVRVDMKGSLYKISDFVYASRKGGVYSSSFPLTLKPSDSKYTIRYTLDCSTPTKESPLYSGGIKISDMTEISDYPLTRSVKSEPLDGAGQGKCVSDAYLNNIERSGNYPKTGCGTVVTFSVYDGDKLLETSSVTYIIKEKAEKYFTVPVICLSMPYENWFDGTDGIYNVVYHDKTARANLEYYDPVSGESFAVNTQVKVGGGWSRGYPKRTLNLNFKRDQNGSKNDPLDVAVFGEEITDKGGSLLSGLTRLRLHNSGNTYESGNLFGDAFFQEICKGENCSTAAYRLCLVYLNGEYWGYYGLREKYSAEFFEDNYGVDDDDVMFAKLTGNVWQAKAGEQSALDTQIKALRSYYTKRNFTLDSVYNEFIENYIDKDSFIDALIFEGFAHNWDYVANNNNFQMWRSSVIKDGVPYYDGKWRVCLHDLDFALQHNSGNYLVPKEYTGTKSNDYSYDKFQLYGKLLSNASFRADLVSRMRELFAAKLSPEVTVPILERMASELKPFFLDNAERWGMNYSIESWLDQIKTLKNRLTYRAGYFAATTAAMYEPFEVDGSTLFVVDNLGNSDSLNNSDPFSVNARSFELEFYVNNDEFSANDARAFIRFAYGSKYFKIYWGAGQYSSQWMSGALADGVDNSDIDYINVGKHKFNIKFKLGKVTLTVDGFFVKEFSLDSEFLKVDSFTFGGMQSKISVNRVKLKIDRGAGNIEEKTF